MNEKNIRNVAIRRDSGAIKEKKKTIMNYYNNLNLSYSLKNNDE